MITDINQLDFNKKYTYADYLTWQFQERVELLKGRIFKMAAPSRQHQEISLMLERHIDRFMLDNNSRCKLYHAPFDVRLPLPTHRIKGDKVSTVVQPDICVICDLSKLDNRGCNGAPDVVIEILSPGNGRRERKEKYDLYESAGVQEYWVVQPNESFVIRYNLDEKGQYIGSRLYTEDDVMESKVLEGFQIDINQIFDK
ncbi:MAG: Uma2 family endonuclease [Saprospiraceae bacterium]|nr:Uma2 family endonuclease [Saprospiraceae bacterium]